MVDYGDIVKALWTGVCDVYSLEYTTDENTGRSVPAEVKIISGEPCRVSYSSISAVSSRSEAAEVKQVIKLLLSKETVIPEGAKIVVTQQGRTESYARSGKPAVYSVHQEIILEKFKEWA